jgi:ubiquinone/menaquinone biosynthesis C-methylase UbiE
MKENLNQIRDQQKESWNKFSSGWQKWDVLLKDFMKPYGDAMVSLLDLQPSARVLDVAAGTGEPGLTIAATVAGGRVTMTDLSDNMLHVAREIARERQLTNVDFQVCDVSELPFEENSFDAVSCRFGFMFFPDMELAAREMTRVLKPGGKLVAAVWDGPEKNFWVTAMMGTIARHLDFPPPPPGAPGMFRCAQESMLTGLFNNAGLEGTGQNNITAQMNIQTAEQYWELMTDVAAPVVSALANADAHTIQVIKEEVFDLLASRYTAGEVVIDAGAIIVYGKKH